MIQPTDLKILERGSRLFVYLIATVAATSGLLFGFDIAVINGAIIFLREQFRLSEVQTEIAASALLVGCVAGASFAGYLSDRFGRRRVLMLSALLFAASAFGAALPRTLEQFIVARFIGGIAIGVASVLAPLYIAEVSPPGIRGRLVSMNQMAIVTGVLLAYTVNWMLSFLGPNGWRWMFAAASVPSIAFFIALFFVPESPRWLTEMGMPETALAILTRVGGREQAAIELKQIEESIAEESGTLRELFQPGLRTALVIAVVLAVLQQITGVNTVYFYGSIIFKEYVGHQSASSAIGANVIIGCVNFGMTILALWLIDKVGRKFLLILSAAGMAISLTVLGGLFHVQPPPGKLILALVLMCAGSFAVGLGPGVWTVMAEIFPTRIRGRAMSIASLSLWVACVALTSTFLSLVKAFTISGAFWLYASLCVVTCLFVWRVVPETKGRSLEEIEKMWKR